MRGSTPITKPGGYIQSLGPSERRGGRTRRGGLSGLGHVIQLVTITRNIHTAAVCNLLSPPTSTNSLSSFLPHEPDVFSHDCAQLTHTISGASLSTYSPLLAPTLCLIPSVPRSPSAFASPTRPTTLMSRFLNAYTALSPASSRSEVAQVLQTIANGMALLVPSRGQARSSSSVL